MSDAQDKQAVKTYFTAEAERFDAIYEGANRSPLQAAIDRLFRTRMLRRRNAAIASLVAEGADCFEVGCGSGRTAVAIASVRGGHVHGIDLAPPMIERAKRHASTSAVGELCSFEVADFDGFEPARRFDTFVAVGVLDYFADPLPMLRRAAQEFAPGGAIVLSWSAKGMILNLARRAWLTTKRCPVRFYSDRDIAQLADEIGGRITRTIKTGTPPLTRDGMARIELN